MSNEELKHRYSYVTRIPVDQLVKFSVAPTFVWVSIPVTDLPTIYTSCGKVAIVEGMLRETVPFDVLTKAYETKQATVSGVVFNTAGESFWHSYDENGWDKLIPVDEFGLNPTPTE